MRTPLLLALLAACGAAPPPATAPPAPRSGQMERAMEHCPSAVPGAHTAVIDIDGGVALDITAQAAEAQGWIREAAQLHAQMGPPTDEHNRHTGRHGGPGRTGHCPVLHDGTQVTFVPIDGGARVTVLAVDTATLDALRAETRERVMSLELTPP